MIVVCVMSALLLAYGGYQARFYLLRRRLGRMEWGELVARVQPVNVGAVAQVAENFLHPSKSQLRLEPGVMWQSIGELEGLHALHTNADAMLDLAVFASRWNSVEGRIVSEMIRRDGVRLKRAIMQIEMAMFFGLGSSFAPFQLQEAAASYHLMRGRLFGLYEAVHVGLYPRLIEVL